MDSSRLSNRSHSKSPSNLNRNGSNWANQSYNNEGFQNCLNDKRSYSPNRTSYSPNRTSYQTQNNGQFRQGESWNNGNRLVSHSPYRYYQKNGNGNFSQRENWNGTIGNYNWPNWQSDIKGVYHNSTNA